MRRRGCCHQRCFRQVRTRKLFQNDSGLGDFRNPSQIPTPESDRSNLCDLVEFSCPEVRGFSHGFCAALGKAGALIAGIYFPYWSTQTRFYASALCGLVIRLGLACPGCFVILLSHVLFRALASATPVHDRTFKSRNLTLTMCRCSVCLHVRCYRSGWW